MEDDEFELLDGDRVLEMKCGNCGHQFYVAIMDCAHCGTECTFSWTRRPTADAIEHLSCEACNQPYQDHEATRAAADLFE